MIEWNYVSPLKVNTAVEFLELKYYYQIPGDLKDCIKKNNGGMPSLSKFNLDNQKSMVFGGLLSFNEGDDDSFYDFVKNFETQDGDKVRLTMFPFGIDPFGNFYCIKDNKVVFFDHESNAIFSIADSFSSFLSMLYA